MRKFGFSTSVTTTTLTAALLLSSACNKAAETSGDTAAKKTDGGDAKVDDKKTADGGGSAAGPGKVAEQPTGLAGAATKAAAGGGANAIGLIPDQAQFIMGLSVGSIMSSPFYKLAEAELNSDPEAQKMLTMIKDCGLDPQKLESVVVGGSQDENFVVVMVGDGLGEDQKAKCLLDGVLKSSGEGGAGDVGTQDGKKSIQFADGRAYLVDDRTLAMVTTAWEGALTSLIDGKGTPASSNSKKDLFAKVNTGATIWAVATIPAELAGMAPMFGAPAEFASVQNLTGSMDLSSGAAINVLAGFGSEDTAKSVATQLDAMLALAKADAPPEFAGLIQSVKIGTSGADLTVAMSATADEMTKLQAAAPI